eukprot:6072935-Prymnesium_polylepis.1
MALYLRISATAASGEPACTCSGTPGRPLYTRPFVGFERYCVIECGPVLEAIYTPGLGRTRAGRVSSLLC